jgi:hypothetical protein
LLPTDSQNSPIASTQCLEVNAMEIQNARNVAWLQGKRNPKFLATALIAKRAPENQSHCGPFPPIFARAPPK